LEKDKKDEREARERNEKLVNKNRIGADIPGIWRKIFICHLKITKISNRFMPYLIHPLVPEQDKILVTLTTN
jgi:hypothetical protein